MARRRSDERGVTVLEVTMAMGISALIVIPLMAWAATAMRVESSARNTEARSAAASLLSLRLPRDMAAAQTVSSSGTDCTGGAYPGGTLVLALRLSGGAPGRIVYTVADGARGGSLVRRTCAADGTLTDEAPLVDELVRPAGGWDDITLCTARPDLGTGPCREVALAVPLDSGTVTVSGIQRVGSPR